MELDDKELEKLKELVPYKMLSPTPQEIITEIERLKERLSFYESDDDTVLMSKEKWEEIKQELQIEKATNKELLSTGADLENKLYEEQDKNKRLNNIIDELEHHLYQEWLEWKDSDCESIYSRAGEDKAIYDYLQELKGSDKK